MTSGVDDHVRAVAYANRETVRRFRIYGPYEVGTKEHAFWLSQYDGYMKVAMSHSLIAARQGKTAQPTTAISSKDGTGGAA